MKGQDEAQDRGGREQQMLTSAKVGGEETQEFSQPLMNTVAAVGQGAGQGVGQWVWLVAFGEGLQSPVSVSLFLSPEITVM